jgi:hypothetical protein
VIVICEDCAQFGNILEVFWNGFTTPDEHRRRLPSPKPDSCIAANASLFAPVYDSTAGLGNSRRVRHLARRSNQRQPERGKHRRTHEDGPTIDVGYGDA